MIYIYSPYRRDETTYTALRVAQAALETTNREVFILPNGPKAGVASPFWDTHVLSRINLLPAILSATSIVHIGVDPDYINMIKHYRKTVAKKCTQILVPLWHSTRLDSVATIQSFFDYCVVPTQAIKKTFTQCVYGKTRTKKLIQLPWDTRMPTTKRKGRVKKNAIKVCVVVDSDAVSNSASFILTVLDELLNSHGHLEFTVLHSKSFTPADKQAIKNLLRDFRARLTFRAMPALENIVTDFHNHDWVWLASRKVNFGAFAILATTCGCPVLAWDIAPYNEIITNDETGVLVPCEVKTNWMQAPAVIHDTSNFVKYASLAFSHEKIFETIAVQSDDSPSKFNDTWCDLLAP
jgi:hypothetical protein